jgi:hypothetical protein
MSFALGFPRLADADWRDWGLAGFGLVGTLTGFVSRLFFDN